MNTIFKLLYLIPLLFILSCDKHLDIGPKSSISNKSFWKTEDDVNGAIAGMYVQLREYAQLNLFYLGEARGENLWSDGLVGDAGIRQYYMNLLDGSSVYPGPSWVGLYRIVNSANLIIKYIDQISFQSDNTKKEALAQAYAMRGFVYFVLAKSWGEVPIRKVPTENSSPETIYLPKSSEKEVFELIKSDLDKAIGLFPNHSYKTGRYYWSKPATEALKGDVYLWTAKRLDGGSKDLETALIAVDAAMNSDVNLLDEFDRIFDYDNKGNKEILMAIRFQQHEVEFNYYRDMYMPSHVLPGNLSADERATIGVTGGNIILSPSDILRSQFHIDDRRRNHSFLELFNSVTGTYFASIPLKGQGLVNAGVRYFVDDVILYRLADVLLMKAEIKNALGQDPSEELNRIRRRAFGHNYEQHRFVSGSKIQNDAFILRERMLELCFEGKRWWDLVRFDKAFELVPSLKGREAEKHLLYFPIPHSVLSLEPLVKQIEGYE